MPYRMDFLFQADTQRERETMKASRLVFTPLFNEPARWRQLL